MNEPIPPSRTDHSRIVAVKLEALAFGLLASIGVLVAASFYRRVGGSGRPLEDHLLTAGAGITGALALAGLLWGLASLLRGQAEQTGLLNRLAASFDATRLPAVAIDPKFSLLAEVRQAIRQARWEDAARHLLEFGDSYPDHPDAKRLAGELDAARDHASGDIQLKLDAAREASDADRVIELREALRPVATADALKTLDRDLAKWFMTLIHRRLRTGTVRPDVVALADRVATTLDETPEGASLRASLPTLRRAAGLCPRCAQPYTGVADACPKCLAGAVGPPGFLAVADEPDPDDALEPSELTDEFGMGQLGN